MRTSGKSYMPKARSKSLFASERKMMYLTASSARSGSLAVAEHPKRQHLSSSCKFSRAGAEKLRKWKAPLSSTSTLSASSYVGGRFLTWAVRIELA